MAKKAEIGDIIEIQTKVGFAYAQFSNYHDDWGALLRILPGTFMKRVIDYRELVDAKEVFFTFFPLQAAINREIVKVAGHELVPSHAERLPLFRNGVPNPATGKVDVWWLWDGKSEWKVGKLTHDQLDFPILSIPSYPVLLDRIETGWTPRRSEEFIQRERARIKQRGAAPNPTELRHYLIFKDQASAEKAAELVRTPNLQTGVTDLGESWGVNVLQAELSDDVTEKLAERLKEFASTAGGIYDGSQVKLTEN
jgi:hypothetical protein